MPLIEAAFADAPEQTLPEEALYDLRIANIERGLVSQKGGRPMIRCDIQIEGDQDYMPIFHYLVFPTKEDWAERRDTAKILLRNMKRFLTVFGIEFGPSGFDDDDLPGATGICLVKLEEGDDGEMRPRIALPRMRDDASIA